MDIQSSGSSRRATSSSSSIAPLLGALARGATAGADAETQRGAAEAAASLDRLARSPADCAALAANARVVPALAATLCSRHADGAVVDKAMYAAANLVWNCPAAARREQQDSLVRLGALEAAVQRLSAGGGAGCAAACLVGALVQHRPEVAGAAAAAGALPNLVALMGDALDPAAVDAAAALAFLCGQAGPPAAAAAVDAGALRALARLLGRAQLSASLLGNAQALLSHLAHLAPAGAERLVSDGALPHVVRLLRSPAQGVAAKAVDCLAAATPSQSWVTLANALAVDATAAPALAALLLGPGGDAPLNAACVLGMTMTWADGFGSPEARRRDSGLAAAVRRAGAVPRLVELLRASLEGEQRRSAATGVARALAAVCHVDAAAAREALGAGAWALACRVVVEWDACVDCADEVLLALGLSLLVDLAPHLRAGAPRPAAAAEPGLVAALARILGHAAPALQPGTHDVGMVTVCNAAAVLEAALAGSDGAQRAAEFVRAGGAGHLVRARQRLGRRGLGGRDAWAV
jgi:hypothetical protein